ncbi:PH domain-containing protein [Rhodococcus artemisiae]|uniref:PH domain-containing protein n=1 Tax=Rhodococcus artemisiae TaxID=714159 RepID=A0ABU7L3V5_9NOCA|nr:PH domain-containing protein [Rhodococcus artemisiae]MEE2056230.1 PH domain-containing protein [Rhodococcus artemisiae]
MAPLLAVDAYRSLGHAVSGDYPIARSGTVRRATVALQRRGIIGWTVKASLFQRRARLVTIVVTTAAGSGAYRIIDVDESDGVAFIESALPHLFVPFLDQAPSLPDRPGLMPPIRR